MAFFLLLSWYLVVSQRCSSIVISNPSLSFIEILVVGMDYDLIRNSCMKVGLREGFTHIESYSLRKKCLYSQFLWSVFSHIWAEYRDFLNTGRFEKPQPYRIRSYRLGEFKKHLLRQSILKRNSLDFTVHCCLNV